MAFDQNVARSCSLFPHLSRFFLWKRYSATPVIRLYACKLLENLDRKQGNVARKYFETKALLKKGINFLRSAQHMNVSRF